jgi:small subunit ribosomal protein S17
MAKKKKDETEVVETPAETTEEPVVEAQTEETVKAADATTTEEPTLIESVIDTVAAAVGTVADAVVDTVSSLVGSSSDTTKPAATNRAQRIGVVTSDKMTKTVVVRVDRLIKHPKYRRYVRRKKQFMAHDELGASIGDKVRIVETRPLSARKRWRVAEIVQKAAK